jgi:hypothetical protein
MKRLIGIFFLLISSILHSQSVDSVYYSHVIRFDGINRTEISIKGEWIGGESFITHRFNGEEISYECYKKIGHNYYIKDDIGESIRVTIMPSGNVILRNEEHTECYTVYRRTE